jgi:DNA-damage-inducible protein D
MQAADGKQRPTDVAYAETLLRLVQSVPSPKAEPIKLWLAKVGYERMQELADPAFHWIAYVKPGKKSTA